MKVYSTALEAKVAARNGVHRLALELAPAMREALRPFVGQKVLNQGHVLSQKLRDALPDTEATVERHFWYSSNGYGLYANFKTCEASRSSHPDTSHANYAETCVKLGTIRDHNILDEIMPLPEFRTDYTQEEVISARVSFRAAREALDRAQSDLCFWGEYDN